MSLSMAVFTLETDNPSRQIIGLIHFPSRCEFETDTQFKFPLSVIHIRRIEAQARLPIHYNVGHLLLHGKEKKTQKQLILLSKSFQNCIS